MKISILVPTRGRPDRLKDSLWSIYNNTSLVKDISILLAVDEDDTEFTQDELPPVTVYRYVRQAGHNNYYNLLARDKACDAYWLMADDVLVKTPNWDNILYGHIHKIVDTPLCVAPASYILRPDGRGEIHFCTETGRPYTFFPIVSKRAVELLGYASPPFYRGWGADYYLHKLFHITQQLIDVPEIVVETTFQESELKRKTLLEDGQFADPKSLENDARKLNGCRKNS